MANGVLGKPHRVVYTAKGLQSGLSGVRAYVLKPDLTRVGPFSLTEVSDSKFAGVYFFDFSTATSDDPGEYIGIIESPNENNYRKEFKIVYTEANQILQAIDIKTTNLPADPASETTVVTTTQAILDDLQDVVRIDDLSNIDGAFNFAARMSTVYKNEDEKHEIMTWLDRGNTRLINTSDCRIRFYKSDNTLVWEETQASPNPQGFFLLESESLQLEKDNNFYVIIDIKDEDEIVRTTTLPTITVG